MNNELYRGIFWIKEQNPIKAIVIKSECSSMGEFLTAPPKEYLADSKDNYNHKNAWKNLDRKLTEGKKFNYYPRGRVEIKNRKATVFVNENVICEEFKKWVKEEFNLIGIPMRIVADMSNHYLCNMDMEEKNE